MNLSEVNKLIELVELDPNEALAWLKNEKTVKEHTMGLISVEIKNAKGETFVVKAFQLSKNFCVIGNTQNTITDFKSFAGLVNVTHTPTGQRLGLLKTTKPETIRLAKELEEMFDFSFRDPGGLAKASEDQKRKIVDLVNSHR